MSKNVNNDISKDPPIATVIPRIHMTCYFLEKAYVVFREYLHHKPHYVECYMYVLKAKATKFFSNPK